MHTRVSLGELKSLRRLSFTQTSLFSQTPSRVCIRLQYVCKHGARYMLFTVSTVTDMCGLQVAIPEGCQYTPLTKQATKPAKVSIPGALKSHNSCLLLTWTITVTTFNDFSFSRSTHSFLILFKRKPWNAWKINSLYWCQPTLLQGKLLWPSELSCDTRQSVSLSFVCWIADSRFFYHYSFQVCHCHVSTEEAEGHIHNSYKGSGYCTYCIL